MFKILTLVILATFVAYSQAGDEFYDYRCICVCPSFTVVGETETNRKIYIDILNKEDCTCENVLKPWKPNPNQTDMLKSKFCPRCNCNFEVRNTTTMKIVVIIIICILALLFIYMGFLLCLDPLMNRRAHTYQEQRNEDINMTNDSTPLLQPSDQLIDFKESDDQPFAAPSTSTRSNVINRVTQEQSKWKRQVQEQRRTVYDKHTLLN